MGIFDRLTERVGGIFGDFIEEVRISDEIHTILQRATKQYEIGHYDEALKTLSLAQTPTPLARVHHLRGLCHIQRGQPQEAARELRRAIELKEHYQSHFWAGQAMAQIHEWRAAQDHFQRALTLSPEGAELRAELHTELGAVYLRQHRADKAIKEIKKGMRASELPPAASVTLAEALFARGRHTEALAALSHAGISELDDLHAHLVHARITRALQMFDDAHDAYMRAVRAASHDSVAGQRAEALLGAARASLELGNLAEVESLLARAEREMSPSALGASFFVLRAMLAVKNREMPMAARLYEQSLVRDPAHPEALLGAADLALMAAQPQAALESYDKVLALHASSPHASLALLGQGRARRALGDYPGARQALEEATRAARDAQYASTFSSAVPKVRSPEIAFELAEVALATKDHARALMDLQEVRAKQVRLSATQKTEYERLTSMALAGLTPQLDLPDALTNPLQVERALQSLQAFIASNGRLAEFLAPTQRIIAALDAPLSIAIVGEFNAGKSTLINAIMGEDILPTGVLPTTAHTGIIQYGPRQAARVVWRGDDDPVEVSFKEAKRLMKDNGEAIDHLQYLAPHPELRAVHFWDTPGFNALEERHEEVASRALREAEAILWVLDANQVLSQTEFDRIKTISAGDERLLIVINKVDRLGDYAQRQADVAHLMDYVQEHAADHSAGCFPVSALTARKTQAQLLTEPDDALSQQLMESGLPAFQEHMHTHIVERAGHIKTIESVRHVLDLTAQIAQFTTELETHYATTATHLHDVAAWVDELREGRPKRVAGFELMDLEDGVDFMLRSIVNEIEEALRPSSSWVSQKMVLGEDDRDYLVELIGERFISLLKNSRDRVFHDIRQLEAELAERIGPLLARHALQDARGLERRLQGFQDEVGVLKLLLEERVYGRVMARAQGQVAAAANQVLDEITKMGSDHQRWKALVRPLLPDLRESFGQELESWYGTFFAAAQKFCERATGDLELLRLEAKHRYKLDALHDLLKG